MTRTPWMAAALLALAACAPKPETPEQAQVRLRAESDSAKVAIEIVNARHAGYVAAGLADSAALDFTEDAAMFSPGTPVATGRAAIRTQLQQWLGMGSWTVTATTDKVEASGPIAVETGHYVMTFRPGPQAPRNLGLMFPDSGIYFTAWRKVDGRWLIANDFSASTRAPAAAQQR